MGSGLIPQEDVECLKIRVSLGDDFLLSLSDIRFTVPEFIICSIPPFHVQQPFLVFKPSPHRTMQFTSLPITRDRNHDRHGLVALARPIA